MRVHYLQHVPYEGLGSIERWLMETGARTSVTTLFDAPLFPEVRDIDWLIVLGGPMSVNDEDTCPWLRTEKGFIEDAMARGKVVLGICLGAQLIASVAGARVYPNKEREIGWFPIERMARQEETDLAPVLPEWVEVFHWHGETFDLPPGAIWLARSEASESQAFLIGKRILGLQFHLETTPEGARSLIESCRGDLTPGPFVQSKEEILSSPERFDRVNAIMSDILDHLIITTCSKDMNP
jgi:GMP synthase-like glutamine amidotransferase